MNETNSKLAYPQVVPASVEGLEPLQAAVVGGFGRTTVFKLIADGRLPARKIGKKTIILRSDLMAFLQTLPRAVRGA